MASDVAHVVATNRQAKRSYDIVDTVECGLVLKGSEVKSLRESKVQLAEAYGRIRDGEAWLMSLYIAPYSHASRSTGHDPDRPKKLLLHRAQIERWSARADRERLQLVPLSLYFKNGRAKVELGLGRSKTRSDRRHVIQQRDADREAERAMARRGRRGR